MVLPLEPTEVPGVCRRGSRFVVVYRAARRQRKQAAATLAEARATNMARQADARERRRGPTLQGFSLPWLDRYAGRVMTSCARRRGASTVGCWSTSQ
jgi:hypothetical protein